MSNRILANLVCAVALLAVIKSFAAVAGKDYVSVEIETVTYEFELPAPFGRSQVVTEIHDQKVSTLAIRYTGQQLKVDLTSVDGDALVGAPAISYSLEERSKVSRSGEIDTFRVTFEAGIPYAVAMEKGVACWDGSTEWVRDVVRFTIYRDGDVKRERLDAAEVLGARRCP